LVATIAIVAAFKAKIPLVTTPGILLIVFSKSIAFKIFKLKHLK
jgi:hypothetical protein